MFGELSIMDWVVFANVISALGLVLTGYKVFRDNGRLFREHDKLSKEHAELSKEATSSMIKKDIEYVSNEMKFEKTSREQLYQNTNYVVREMEIEKEARKNLYKNSSRAKEILETMDMMKEVVLQNAQLNAENSALKQQNHELLFNDNQEQEKLFQAITAFERRLSGLEGYKETEEIRSILKSIERQLLEHVE
ncbi:TPA: hypothetical protein U1C31_001290 [Streptococcus suis]|nr:hypothetical protein [Streptococcus suis]